MSDELLCPCCDLLMETPMLLQCLHNVCAACVETLLLSDVESCAVCGVPMGEPVVNETLAALVAQRRASGTSLPPAQPWLGMEAHITNLCLASTELEASMAAQEELYKIAVVNLQREVAAQAGRLVTQLRAGGAAAKKRLDVAMDSALVRASQARHVLAIRAVVGLETSTALALWAPKRPQNSGKTSSVIISGRPPAGSTKATLLCHIPGTQAVSPAKAAQNFMPMDSEELFVVPRTPEFVDEPAFRHEVISSWLTPVLKDGGFCLLYCHGRFGGHDSLMFTKTAAQTVHYILAEEWRTKSERTQQTMRNVRTHLLQVVLPDMARVDGYWCDYNSILQTLCIVGTVRSFFNCGTSRIRPPSLFTLNEVADFLQQRTDDHETYLRVYNPLTEIML